MVRCRTPGVQGSLYGFMLLWTTSLFTQVLTQRSARGDALPKTSALRCGGTRGSPVLRGQNERRPTPAAGRPAGRQGLGPSSLGKGAAWDCVSHALSDARNRACLECPRATGLSRAAGACEWDPPASGAGAAAEGAAWSLGVGAAGAPGGSRGPAARPWGPSLSAPPSA